MSCLSEEQVLALLDGALDPAARAEVDEHLAGCSRCARLVAASSEGVAADPDGETVGRYQIEGPLAAGGMGIVYAARDPDLHRRVAIKLLRPGLDAGAEGQERVLREARAMARLSHPNVVAIYDVGTFRGQVFIAMELVEGVTLSQWLAQARRTPRQIISVFAQAGRGLSAAHEAGLVHRDFKPDNVLVAGEPPAWRICVTDFGLAREAEAHAADGPVPPAASRPAEAAGSAPAGTPPYMSPEQLAGAPASATSDLFAFCVALWEALYGARPFAGRSPEELSAAMHTAPRPPRTAGRVPARVRALLLRGLGRDPAQRPASMAEVVAVLDPPRRLVSGRALAVAAALALLAVAGAGVIRAHLCDGGDGAIAAAWNPRSREAVRSSLTASGQPGAVEIFAAVAATLDRFAADWRAQRRDACEATRLRREQSNELLEGRNHCLDLKAAEFSGLVDVLAQADKEIASSALRAAEALSDVGACSAAHVSRARVPVAGEKQAAEVHAIERDLAQTVVLTLAGRTREGLQKIEPLVARADSAGYAPIRSEVLYQEARLRYSTGDPAGAVRSAREALRAAEEGRDEWLASLAWNWLSVGELSLGHVDAAEEDLSHSESLLRTALDAPGDEPLRDRQLYRLFTQRGSICQAQGKLAEAADAFGRALAIAERSGPRSRSAAMSIYSLGTVEQKQGKWDEALQHYQRSLALLEQLVGPSHFDVTLPLSGVAAWMNNAGRSAEALALQRRIAGIVEESLGQDNLRTVPYLNNLCESLGSAGQADEAVATCQRALAIREAALGRDSPGVALVLDTLGVVLRERGDARAAVSYLSRAVAIWELKAPDHLYLAEALTHLGQALTDAGEPARAQVLLERALARREAPPQNQDELAETRFALAQALFALGRGGDRARSLAEQARAVWAAMGPARARQLESVDAALSRRR